MLSRQSIARLLQDSSPLLRGYSSMEDQLQPNGFDLTVGEIYHLATPGHMGRDANDRAVSELEIMEFPTDGWLDLLPGPYLVTFAEEVSLPLSLMALCLPRSSLIRSGVSIGTGVGDAGYRGRFQALLVVHHPAGYRLQRGARVAQLVFFPLDTPADQGYAGAYLNENLPAES